MKYQFVLTELDLGITFGNMALSARREDKAKRNTENARSAYSAVRRFIRDESFTSTMNREINERCARLETLLRRLTEQEQRRGGVRLVDADSDRPQQSISTPEQKVRPQQRVPRPKRKRSFLPAPPERHE